jgi:hypothetical protein
MLLLAALLFIQIADLVSTAYGFKLGLIEGSPIPAKLFARFGFWPASIAAKLLTLGICWAVQSFISNGWIFTALLCLVGIGVCAWNVHMIARAR